MGFSIERAQVLAVEELIKICRFLTFIYIFRGTHKYNFIVSFLFFPPFRVVEVTI